jgi:hypothetical protein
VPGKPKPPHQYPKIKQKFKTQRITMNQAHSIPKINMVIPLCNPCISFQSTSIHHGKPNKKVVSITNSASSSNRVSTQRRTMSAFEARISLIFALASQSTFLSQRRKCHYKPKNPTYLFIIYFFFNLLIYLFIYFVMQLLPMPLLRLQSTCFQKDLKAVLSKKRS